MDPQKLSAFRAFYDDYYRERFEKDYQCTTIITPLIRKYRAPDSLIGDAGCGFPIVLNALFDSGFKNIFGQEISRTITDKTHRFPIYPVALPEIAKTGIDLLLTHNVLYHLSSAELLEFKKNLLESLSPSGYYMAICDRFDQKSIEFAGHPIYRWSIQEIDELLSPEFRLIERKELDVKCSAQCGIWARCQPLRQQESHRASC
ncbi:MAG: hypothetical protein P4M08_10250 [Oligoflexia bacterium]|nr:hypothetical protein [Oligoflexia bacterium]